MVRVIKFELSCYIYLLIGDSGEAAYKQTGDIYYSDKIVNNVEILAQSSADIALTYNFQGTRILGASRCHLCDSTAFLYVSGLVLQLYRMSSNSARNRENGGDTSRTRTFT